MSLELAKTFEQIRLQTEKLCEPLEAEDYTVQTMLDVSPTKWHLGHTSWFFETFVLKVYLKNYREFHPKYNYLFNSYYNTIGDRHARLHRGNLTRPFVKEIYAYRKHVTENMLSFLQNKNKEGDVLEKIIPVISIGINHEQQHQELILTDIKHVFSQNPLYPVYSSNFSTSTKDKVKKINWFSFASGVTDLGTDGEEKFCFDNESPKHKVFIEDYQLADRLVTNGEYLEFIEDKGYDNHYLWLSEGWDLVKRGEIDKPFYWVKRDGQWHEFTLEGMNPLKLDQPVAHLTYFEAEAYARWANCHLPTESEWENGIKYMAMKDLLNKPFDIHPRPFREYQNKDGKKIKRENMVGELWEWTSSHYSPYPRYDFSKDAIGEYNGKFMSNQFVLRGASCITPEKHVRITYRNFFPTNTKWQFSGIRLARYI